MEEQKRTMGKRLVTLRQQNGLTQEMLSEKLSISRQSVSKWETDGALPDLEKLTMLSDIYHVSLDYLVKGEASSEPAIAVDDGENTTNKDNAAGGGKIANGEHTDNPFRPYLAAATILSAVCGLFALLLAGNIWFHFALFPGSKEQEFMTVTQIYKQYTKAEVSGVTDDGGLYTKILWLDNRGVTEGDLVWGYVKGSGHVSFPYYGKTVWIPTLCAALLLLTAVFGYLEIRYGRTGKRRHSMVSRPAVFSILGILTVLFLLAVLLNFTNTAERKQSSRENGQEANAHTESDVPEEKENVETTQAFEESFLLEGYGISLQVPLTKGYEVQGSYHSDGYYSVLLYGKDGGTWADCNLHEQTDFYENALDYMMIRIENAKDWDAKWAGQDIELKTANICGRACYYYEIHYQYDGSDIKRVVAACDIDESHFYQVDFEGMDYDGDLDFERIQDIFKF